MKMTQAWGWLVAGVLAAGLNASYHNGGLQWAHQAVDQITGQVEHSSAAVLALASGNVEQFLSQARLLDARLTAQNETASCPLTGQLARVQTELQAKFQSQAQAQPMLESMFENKLARSQAEIDLWSARDEARLARLEAQRERMEARIEAQISSQINAQTSHLRISTVNFAPAAVALRAIPARVACPRIQVNVPRLPAMRMPVAPEIHIDLAGNGPV